MGIQDIVKKCTDYGLPEPEFKIKDGFVAIIYRKNRIAMERIEGGQIGQIAGQNQRTQDKILDIIKNNNRISRKEIADILGINESAVQKHLHNLKNKNIIERIGKTRGYWLVL